MLQMFVITMREGIEAFLIVAIMAAYLRKTGRDGLLPAVWWGTGTAVVLSVAASVLLKEAADQPLWESMLAGVAAVLVATMTVYMWRTARTLRATINGRLAQQAARSGGAAMIGVFAFALVMITREGMETALLITSLALQADARDMLAGAVGGVSAAGLIAWAWTRYGHRVNLARFFQVTAVFLLLFLVQLVIYTLHELFEANVLPGIDNEYWHVATEPYGPEGQYGQMLTYFMVAVPALWLFVTWARDWLTARSAVNAPARG